ncbi:hypothetical protein IWQ62_000519 [Dispira parvispora]|uniref:Uncharacterized protein n=1 Tax=Dispira parvispora TaxID=1520584 RepID=A0A9W8E9J6_9FUNG|nr:hypothetical protein IWQ62_000519 [Dispira parvispora]
MYPANLPKGFQMPAGYEVAEHPVGYLFELIYGLCNKMDANRQELDHAMEDLRRIMAERLPSATAQSAPSESPCASPGKPRDHQGQRTMQHIRVYCAVPSVSPADIRRAVGVFGKVKEFTMEVKGSGRHYSSYRTAADKTNGTERGSGDNDENNDWCTGTGFYDIELVVADPLPPLPCDLDIGIPGWPLRILPGPLGLLQPLPCPLAPSIPPPSLEELETSPEKVS